MATYFVASGGSNTAPYDTWAKAATSLQTALTAATSTGDIVVLQYDGVPSGDAEVSGTTTWTFGGHIALICASNDGGSSYTPTPMGETGWIGHSTAARTINFAFGAFRVFIFGLTVRNHGTATVQWGTSDGSHAECVAGKFWSSSTSASVAWWLGAANNGYTHFVAWEFKAARTSTTSDTYVIRARCDFDDCPFIAATATSGGFLTDAAAAWPSVARFTGCDFSGMPSSLTYVGNNTRGHSQFVFDRCDLSVSPTMMATQSTVPNRGSAEVYVLDCNAGDTHLAYEYRNAFGSLVLDTSVYYTTTGYSWKIDTTANCSYFTPFIAPIFGVYHAGTSAITPYVEILRDGSTTPYQNDEIWLQVGVKATSGSTKATLAADRCTLANKLGATLADQANGAGTGSWTGDSGAWSGKIDSGSSLTPAEVGEISAQVFVGEPSITVYVDPVIRT